MCKKVCKTSRLDRDALQPPTRHLLSEHTLGRSRCSALKLRDSVTDGTDEEPRLHIKFLPQVCHKLKRTEKDNGGFLRFTKGDHIVAKTGVQIDFFP